MIQLAHTNASGARTRAAGSRYTRGRSGLVFRNAASARGAPAYISTEELVAMPTSLLQLGNGSRNNRPIPVANRTPNTGTCVRLLVRSNSSGTYPLRASARLIREDVVAYNRPVPNGQM